MDRIKVLWIFTGGLRRNGICVSQLDYYKYLDKEQFQVDALAVHNNTEEMISAYKKAGCKVFEVPDRRKHLLKYVSALKKLIVKENYNIVHVYGSSTLMFIELMVAKKCGCEVRIAHSRNTTCDRPWLEKYLRKIFDSSYNVALACGSEAGEWLFKNKEYTILFNGKELEKYRFKEEKRNEIRACLNISANDVAIGHVGLFNHQKNHSFLIDTFKLIHEYDKNTKLFLMGTGPTIDEIKQKVIQFHLHDCVIFLGSILNVQDYLSAMDIMLFPSLFEGLPNVVIEWQASGLPCIVSDKITKECAVCDLVNFVSIDEGTEIWLDEYKKTAIKSVDERVDFSNIACGLLEKNGFEIEANTVKLEDIYKKSVKEYGYKK